MFEKNVIEVERASLQRRMIDELERFLSSEAIIHLSQETLKMAIEFRKKLYLELVDDCNKHLEELTRKK